MAWRREPWQDRHVEMPSINLQITHRCDKASCAQLLQRNHTATNITPQRPLAKPDPPSRTTLSVRVSPPFKTRPRRRRFARALATMRARDPYVSGNPSPG
ncbi:hypothetical protein HBI56_133510 [Parastagonospora nodorum]|uniref:Uncharacterized protein n=1 Tax=Phaeosphaeria nodorum (strain SN15 / ATCC MYA-4574 / FGSC 10173) TaxID=321614 RepID=A0A7U2F775_PHANO|nr:hypothetical protein HBH56_036620 [Parastagonospora nodorum]QRD00014.1 hypothetical protein JI435_437810 [Parastagonospora nodorum SN15]KAH3933868.1 hypothetical protein HBH54_062850 [Parastagonospora nodorum]KAH3952793.1 hypothetical protein HBH53_047260 [Parastagonospora nodorum]KAH3979800.1 hypothetical protein HBH51_058270 [Parastagonospora nodorum]